MTECICGYRKGPTKIAYIDICCICDYRICGFGRAPYGG